MTRALWMARGHHPDLYEIGEGDRVVARTGERDLALQIKAAPDMLHALIAAEFTLTEVWRHVPMEDWRHARVERDLATVRAAVAKAEGRD